LSDTILTIALFKNTNGIPTKKAVYKMLDLEKFCSYKTMVVGMNRFAKLAAIILLLLAKAGQQTQHLIKHIDSTDIPVCLNKNAKRHKTMAGLAAWGRSSKGKYFGIKLHLITDLLKKILSFKFTPANVDDREYTEQMLKYIWGIIVADAGYVSEQLAQDIYIEGQRIFIAKPRKNMKKLMTKFQELLYGTRMKIEYNFRDLKMFKGLITSLPRSIDGYLANYVYALLAYQIA